MKLAAVELAALLSLAVTSGVGGCERPRRDEPAAEAVTVPAAIAPALDCGSVLLHLRSVLTVQLATAPGAMVKLERGLGIAGASCRDDAWPESLRACLRDVPVAATEEGVKALWRCGELVPEPLRRTLEEKLRAAIL